MALPQPVLLETGEREEAFRLLVESVRDYAIFMLDPHGYITTWNNGAERIKGYAARDVIGSHFSLFYPPEDVETGKPLRALQIAEREGRFEEEAWRVRKDGTRFWASVVITALRDGSGHLRGFGKVTRDLTSRRHAEETARQLAVEQAAREVAERAESFQRHLLAMVGHDLRNCLSVILTAGEMLRSHPDDTERVARRSAQVVNSARRLGQIIRGIIDYTHAQRAEGLPISPREDADFHLVCDRVIQDYRLLNPSRRIIYDAEGSPIGEWDETRLEQVVQNLVGNALKYSPSDSTVTVRWWREGDDANDGDLVLSVHNDGPPIPPELLPHVFESFRSGRKSGAESKDSMGLGLFIVREILRSHGGEVRVESTAERGTILTARLPPHPPRRSPSPA